MASLHLPRLQVGGLKVDVLYTPCHTPGHVCYYVAAAQCVFTGDTLFIGFLPCWGPPLPCEGLPLPCLGLPPPPPC